MLGSDSVVGVKDAKDLRQSFMPDHNLKLSRNTLKKEALVTFSLTFSPPWWACLSRWSLGQTALLRYFRQ